MHTINRDFFEETSLHLFTALISELEHGQQLPGRRVLPKVIHIPGVGINHMPFIATVIDRSDDGTLLSVEYLQQFGCVKAVIFND